MNERKESNPDDHIELVHFHEPSGWRAIFTLDGTVTHEEVHCLTCRAVIGSRTAARHPDSARRLGDSP